MGITKDAPAPRMSAPGAHSMRAEMMMTMIIMIVFLLDDVRFFARGYKDGWLREWARRLGWHLSDRVHE
jgi:hypothetical protein